MEERLTVSKIRSGTVIDHIPAGEGLRVLRILGITGREGLRIALLMNVESKRLGRKDIVKIEGRRLAENEADLVALIAPTATINIIDEYKVVEKRKARLPERIIGLIECPNPTCITRKKGEPLEPVFTVIRRKPVMLRCEYCGTLLPAFEIGEHLRLRG